MAPDQLGRFRAAVVDDLTGAELEQAIAAAEAAGIETFGEALKTAPRGYPRDHPRVRLLRHKALGAGRRLPAGAAGSWSGPAGGGDPGRGGGGGGGIDRDAALGHARTTWAGCARLSAWLEAHVGPSRVVTESRYGRGRRSG
ncbi:MAG: DUF2461 domain-containing protein [Actinobacteria bacterium]|nr:DUF2461 domain-containing protein [Actinomycetota bacterium]